MDEQTFFSKIYQFVVVFVGGLVSFFFYRQKKVNDQLDTLDKRVNAIEVNQAGYNKSVDYLIKRFDKLEKNIEDMLKSKK